MKPIVAAPSSRLERQSAKDSNASRPVNPNRDFQDAFKFCLTLSVLAAAFLTVSWAALKPRSITDETPGVVTPETQVALLRVVLGKFGGLLLHVVCPVVMAFGILLSFGYPSPRTDGELTDPRVTGITPRKAFVRQCTPIAELINSICAYGCPDVSKELIYEDLGFMGWIPMFNGNSSDVYQSSMNPSGAKVAFKCSRFTALSADTNSEVFKEASRALRIWYKLQHKNVAKLHGLAQLRGRMGIVTPWMENGNIVQYTKAHPSADRYFLCAQVARGLSYLHAQRVVHGNLKGSNVLIHNDGTAKITDLGNAILEVISPHSDNIYITGASCYSVRWTAPEILEESPCTTKSDVYALAMTILEVITGRVPYPEKRNNAYVIQYVISHGEIPWRPYDLQGLEDDEIWDNLVRCWSRDPEMRPTTAEIESSLMLRSKLNTTPSC